MPVSFGEWKARLTHRYTIKRNGPWRGQLNQEGNVNSLLVLGRLGILRAGVLSSRAPTSGEVVRPKLPFGLLPTWSLFKVLFCHRNNDGVSISPRSHCHLIPGDSD